MAAMDVDTRPRETLPPISHLDLIRLNTEKHDGPRFVNGVHYTSTSAALTSPTASVYSIPPPPYSAANSTAPSTAGLTGYISPPESTTRRSTRDDRDSPGLRKSLPSIHEALGEKPVAFAGQLSAPAPSQHAHPHHHPPPALGQPLPEGPAGPANPFSQPPAAPPVLRDVFAPPPPSDMAPTDPLNARPSFAPAAAAAAAPPEPRHAASQSYLYPGSPRSQPAAAPPFHPPPLSTSSFHAVNHSIDPPPTQSPQTFEPQARPSLSFPPFTANGPPNVPPPPPHEPFQFTAGSKPDEPRATAPYPKAGAVQYSEAVKRHLDGFDAELWFNEINEASARTLDFARVWAQRYHQGSRAGFYHDALPTLGEVDDILRHSHRITENLTHLRGLVVAQQTALSEQRARQTRGSMDDDYHVLGEEYRGASYGGGDAKKRRGKAAPPGRCHSCNRAETPEWRRGPDGARTLCNACGLHYAKLTRKIGINKAAALTGSNLRPKHLETLRP